MKRPHVIPRLEPLEPRWAPAVQLLGNFQGIDFITSQAGNPPDTDVAVGPNHVVETVNLTLAIYNKTNGQPLFTQEFSRFFAPVGVTFNMSDPVVTYDELAQRFVVAVLEFSASNRASYINVAFSNDADPTHGFDQMRRIDIHETMGTQTLWGDYPKVGWNADAVVFTANMYAFGGGFKHVQIITIDKQTLDSFRVDRTLKEDGTLAAASIHQAVAGGPAWFLETNDGHSNLRLVRMTDFLSNEPHFTDWVIGVPSYTNVVGPLQPNGQSITDNIEDGILNVALRGDTLVASQNVGHGGVMHARWYQFDLHGGNNPALVQSGEIDPGSDVFTYFPAIDVAPNGNLGLSFIESSVHENMSTYVTGRTSVDPPGAMERPVLVKAGEAIYRGNRAGDFSGISIDPSDGSFWAANEYSAVDGRRNWGTWIAHFAPLHQTQYFATGADAGGGPAVHVYDADTGVLIRSFFAYDPSFLGGVRVALADLNGDGVPDIITAPGPGGGPDVRVFDGSTGAQIRQFFAYDPSFVGGVYVAAGDVDGDGIPDIITGADAGGGPHVKVFSGKDNAVLRSFFAFDPSFVGGVRVAAGDVDGDGRADIIAGAGPGGGPHVKIFSGKDNAVLRSFFAYDPSFVGGIFVAAGDTNGDGKADIVVGPGSLGGPHVKVFSGADNSVLQSFFAYDPSFFGGVRVGTFTGNNGLAQILTAPGPTGGPDIRARDGRSLALLDQFFAYDPFFFFGVFVGGR